MILFYTRKIQDGLAIIDDDEYKHCIKTLRKRAGDQINLTDGEGNLFYGKIEAIGQDLVRIRILEKMAKDPPAPELHIAMAPTKQLSRFEWFVEKSTELGIHEITPIICRYSEKRNVNAERLQRIALSAMKQSLRVFLPIVHPAISFSQFMEKNLNLKGLYLAHYSEGQMYFNQAYNGVDNAVVLIGPEGDFSPEELELAKKQQFRIVNLSENRLRTETAGIVACAQFFKY